MTLDNIQKYARVYDYIHDYNELVQDYYSKHAISFLITYYNHDMPSTVWDDNKLFGGSYEKTGELSGRRWNKILYLPVYFMDEVTTAFDGQDIGYVKEGQTSFAFPSTYGITPYPGDMLKFDQTFLRATNDKYPVFQVSGAEIYPNTDKRFWKLTAKVYQSKTIDALDDDSLSEVHMFVDYDKKIHTLNDGLYLTRLLTKNENLRDKLKGLFDDNSGFYLS